MKQAIILFSFILLCLPVLTFASECSSSGATIVYVNGIETTQQDADNDTQSLRKLLLDNGSGSDVQILTGYNPSHLDGYGDELESVSQALNAPISDYDLDTILTQIAPEVTTQKVLLVGHSQGTFYTNEMYGYLVKNGVSPSSIAVYNLATPASTVAGGGTYLTSANDKVINYVRELDAEAGAPQALPANIIIPEESGYADNAWGGHFPEVYLDGAAERIVSDIRNALGKLSVSDTDTADECFTPPPLGLSYDAQKAVFSAADPAVASVDYAAADAKNTVASVMDNENDIIHTALADVYYSVVPKPTLQSAAGAFAVEKALYGSSLSVADYEALAQGQDIPEVQAPTENPPQPAQKVEQPQSQPVQIQPVEKQQQTAPVPLSGAAPAPVPVAISISPGFGGGSPPVAVNVGTPVASDPDPDASSSPQTGSSDQVASTTEPSDIVSLPATTTLPFSVFSPADQTTFSTTTVAFSGTTSPDAVVFASFGATSSSAIADASGNWSFQFDLPSGTTTVALSAADLSGNYSATSTLTIGVALPPPEQLPALAVSCPDFEGGGYFFDPSYMEAEYVGGLLRIHLRLLAPYNDGRVFHATVIVNGSDCISLSPNFGGGPGQTWLPAGIQYYSFRMSSPTHWILWDDEHDVQATCDACEGDIPAGVASVSFAAMIGSGASTLTTYPYPPTWP